MLKTESNREGPWTVIKLLSWTTSYFNSHQIDSPRIDAEVLLAHALDCRRIDLYLKYDQPLSADELSRFKALIRRRRGGEPVAYIVGQKAFWTMDMAVSRDVLVPRPETEHLVEASLAQIQAMQGAHPLKILEVGTGTGAVVIALTLESPGHRFVATDISKKALQVARINAARYEVARKIDFVCTDVLEAFQSDQGLFDIIVSNPPYIATDEIPRLQKEIACYEPFIALDGGPEGMDMLSRLLGEANHYLAPGGALIMEMGAGQRQWVQACCRDLAIYRKVHFYQDYGGRDRIVKVVNNG